MPDGPRYDDDYYAWTQYQAEVLRTMRRADNRLDRELVAEEIEDLGKSERDTVRSQIRRIIEHFLKLEYSPATDPRFDWTASIIEARQILSDKMTATLRRDAESLLPQLYADGRERAEIGLRKFGETDAAVRLPTACPYILDQSESAAGTRGRSSPHNPRSRRKPGPIVPHPRRCTMGPGFRRGCGKSELNPTASSTGWSAQSA